MLKLLKTDQGKGNYHLSLSQQDSTYSAYSMDHTSSIYTAASSIADRLDRVTKENQPKLVIV